MKSIAKTNSRLPFEINSENTVIIEAWNPLRTLCHHGPRNLQWKLRHYRLRNRHWKLSDDGHMKSTAKTNSRLTHQNQKRSTESSLMYWIITENCVTTNPEIFSENQVIKDLERRNHNWKLSDGWRMKSTAKTNSRLPIEINSENTVIIDTWNPLRTLRPYGPINLHWKLSHYRPRNHHWKLSDDGYMKSTAKTNSRLTYQNQKRSIESSLTIESSPKIASLLTQKYSVKTTSLKT